MFRSIFSSIVLLLIVIFIWACRSTTEVIVPPQDLLLTVKGLQGEVQPNARVLLFDDPATFRIQNATFGSAGAVREAITDEFGKVKFDSLRSDINYYVMAYTIDSTTFGKKGYWIYNDNSRTGFQFLQKLNRSSTTYATVSLLPAEALVSFYASDFNQQALPIQVFVGDQFIGEIKNIQQNQTNVKLNNSSTPDSNGVFTRKIRLGVNPTVVRFVNYYECNNIGTLDATPGGFTPINVNKCNAGKVIFYTNDPVQISIFLNGDNFIGSLNDSTQSNRVDSISRSLEAGKYTYFASSKTCVWQDTFSLANNSRKEVFISSNGCK